MNYDEFGYQAQPTGQAFTYRLRMSNPEAESELDGKTYRGAEWELSVRDGNGDNEFVLGRVLLEGDTANEGIDRWRNFHEHIGCTPCDAFYEKTTVQGPSILQPEGVHRIKRGFVQGIPSKFTCRLHREVARDDGLTIQMETGPGVTPAPETDEPDGGTLFRCTK